MNTDDHPLLNTITDRHGNVTHVNHIVRDFFDIEPDGICEVVTGDFARWRYPKDAQLNLIDVTTIPRHYFVMRGVDRELSQLRTGEVPLWAKQDPPDHVLDVIDRLARDHGVAASLDGPHYAALPWTSEPAGPSHWRIMLVRDRTNHVIAEIGGELILPESGGEGCTVHAWARELDEAGERTRHYAELPAPKKVQSLAAGIAELLATAAVTYA